MTKSLLKHIAFVALAALTVTSVDRALAQSAGTQSLEKENAALRARIHRLEVQQENTSLRTRLDQLQGHRQLAQSAPTPPPQAAAPIAIRRDLIMADMDLKAPPSVLPRYYSWTGFYLGGNIGYSVGSDRARGSLSNAAVTDASGADLVVAPIGAIGGGQVGYNWQGGPNWLVGFEADFQGSGQKGTSCMLFCLNAGAAGQQAFTVQHKIDYFGTVRGRVGVVSNNALFYVTGGGAYGRVDQTLGGIVNTGPGAFSTTLSSVENKFGFVVGAGVEATLAGNWTGKLEYLYMDLGSTATSGPIPLPATLAASSNIHDNIIRAGLNYRLGGPSAPLSVYDAVAAVPMAAPSGIYSWTGLYVGGNVGYGFGNDLVAQTIRSPVLATTEPNSHITPKGVVGGVQLGYNWQGGRNWLVGFEADLQGTAQTDTACAPAACVTLSATSTTDIFTVQHQLDYFGTLRGRLGAINDNVVYYVTGGAAFGHVKQTVNVNATQLIPPDISTHGSTADMIGWVVGGGIEAALWGGWTAKAEYLYMDLGSLAQTFTLRDGEVLTTNSMIRDHIVRVGANYRLN